MVKMIKRIKQFLNRSSNTKEINYEDLNRKMKQNNTVLLDVRSKQEYEEGHLPQAVHISLYDLAQQIEKKIPNKDTCIIVYCSSGSRSKQAQQLLIQMGYEEVYNLKNGYQSIYEIF